MAKDRAQEKQTVIAPEETALFCEQIALLMHSGVMLSDGVEALCEAYRKTKYSARFNQLEQDVKETGSLYEAVRNSELFPAYMVNMVRIGEQSGSLEQVMESLGAYYAREAQIRRSIRNAIAYPLMLIVMMAVLITILSVSIMPIFREVFSNLGTDLSPSAKAMMEFGTTAGNVILALVAVLIVAGIVVFALYKSKHRQGVLRTLGKVFPAFRRINEKLAAARFASVTGKLLSSGFPIQQVLEMAPTIMPDEQMKQRVLSCQKAMDEGKSFVDAVEDMHLFADIHNKMIRVGNTAGQLDVAMSKLSILYEEEVDEDIRRLASIIEPTIIALLAVIIGAVLLSVMLPLASIMSSIT